jgi:cytochrome P450
MSTAADVTRRASARVVPLRQTIAGLLGDPLRALEQIGQDAGGEIVRVNIGPFRPYLVTHPDHVRHVLRDNVDNYVREGMLWRPLRPLIGNGIVGEGTLWSSRRRLMQPMFTAKSIEALVEDIAAAVAAAADDIAARGRRAAHFDAGTEMTGIVHRVLVRAFFGNRISVADSNRLAAAVADAFTSLGARMLLPFVPQSVPLPGDRRFRRAVSTVDGIIYPVVRECRRDSTAAADIVSVLCRSLGADVDDAGDQQVRDDVVAMFVGGTETTAMALTWLWVALARHPEVFAGVSGEIDRVVGSDRPSAQHLPDLRYTKMVINEVLRLHPPAWMVPRSARNDDVIDGVRIKKGAAVLLSPFLTHRMEAFWDRPYEFDPKRWAPDRSERRHRYAYYPFIGGMHQCLGMHLVLIEAQLIVATLLSRFQPAVASVGGIRARAAVTLRPRSTVRIALHPRGVAAP